MGDTTGRRRRRRTKKKRPSTYNHGLQYLLPWLLLGRKDLRLADGASKGHERYEDRILPVALGDFILLRRERERRKKKN